MLFSATQTRKTEDLARISLKKEPIYVGVDDDREMATVDGLEQVGFHDGLWIRKVEKTRPWYGKRACENKPPNSDS